MADENTPGQPQAGEPAQINPQGQEPTTPPTDPQAGESHKSQRSAEEYEREIAALRKENAAHRTKNKAYEEADAKRAEAQMTAEQKKDKELADLRKAYEDHTQATFDRMVNLEIRAQAAALGVNPKHLDKIARFVEWEDIEPDADGNPTGIKEAVEKLLKDMPELLGKGTAPSAPTGGGTTNPSRSQVAAGEVNASYVADVMSGKIAWQSLTNEQRTAVLTWQAKNPYRF